MSPSTMANEAMGRAKALITAELEHDYAACKAILRDVPISELSVVTIALAKFAGTFFAEGFSDDDVLAAWRQYAAREEHHRTKGDAPS